MTWIDEGLAATEDVEAPKRFIYWALLCSISAVVKRNIYLDRYTHKVYPGIYVMFIAPSGSRKTWAIDNLAIPLVQCVGNTRVIAGCNSIQGIIKALSTTQIYQNRPPILDASGFLGFGEFGTALINDPIALTTLGNLWDSHYSKDWNKTLKAGIEELKDISVTMLAATNMAHFKDKITEVDVEGGFLGRTIIVEEDDLGKLNPGTKPPAIDLNITKLAAHLKEISFIKEGQFHFTPEAQTFWEEWYMGPYDRIRKIEKTGFSAKFNIHVIKVAMLLSLSRGLDLLIRPEDIEDAIQLCEPSLNSVKKITQSAGKGGLAKQTFIVLEELAQRPTHQIAKQDLLNKYLGSFEASELERVLDTLLSANVITISKIGERIMITLKQEKVEEFERFKNRKVK